MTSSCDIAIYGSSLALGAFKRNPGVNAKRKFIDLLEIQRMLVSGMAGSRGSMMSKVFGLSVSFTFLCFGFSPQAISTLWLTAPGIKISYQLSKRVLFY